MKRKQDVEIWVDIPKFEGYYQISSHGQVKRVEAVVEHLHRGKVIRRRVPERILKTCQPSRACALASLSVEKVITVISVPVMVAQLFIGPCPNGNCVAHKDEDYTNNHFRNLEYITISELAYRTADNLQRTYGVRTGHTKLTPKKVMRIKKMLQSGNYQQKEIAEFYGISSSMVSRIHTGGAWGHV